MEIVYFKPEVNIHEICKEGFNYDDGIYTLKTELGEYIGVNVDDRSVIEYGYDALVMSWIDEGYIQGYESKADKDQRLLEFPYTIGKITFISRRELEEWVLEKQE